MYVEVVVNLPIEGTFHYHIPAELAGRLELGHLVEVSFGRQKAQGIILSFDRKSPVAETKPIIRVFDRQPVITSAQLELARWMSEYYLATLADCLRLFLPPGLSRQGDMLLTPLTDPAAVETESPTERAVLNLLAKRGPLRRKQIARALPKHKWEYAVKNLIDRHVLVSEPVLDPPSVKAKQVRVVDLGVAPAQVEAMIELHFNLDDLPAPRHNAARRRSAILRTLAQAGKPLLIGEIYRQVEGSGLSDLSALLDDDLIAIREEEMWRDPVADMHFVPKNPPPLVADQQRVWEYVGAQLDQAAPPPILLHGVTGSGKTEIYLRAVDKVLAQGRQALVLVPEIALTPQTIRRFGERFPGRIGVIHSRLSSGERYDTWRRARSGLIDIVIGPRSALFTPFANPGLIVLDECHDDSYKQADSPGNNLPRYHTVHAAAKLAELTGSLVILGSATPGIITYAQSSRPDESPQKRYTLLELPNRIMGHREAIETQAMHYHIDQPRYIHAPGDPEDAVMIELPPVTVVDMRQELRAGNRSIFSRVLYKELEATLRRNEQAILFLNRRGTSTYVFCRNCGYVQLCPNCDIPMTWHLYNPHDTSRGFLACHYCNQRAEQLIECPACQSDQIRYFGGGTEQVERELVRHFPQAKPVRWDRDTTEGKDKHDELLSIFIRGEARVLVGTQMVAKGLDLPLVTLVGVISADTALHMPDYRNGEQTFQLMTQVAGRAGRGVRGGQVILQTYRPEHYAIQAASEHNFHRFYEQELRYRGEMGYPPYSRLARLIILEETRRDAEKEATQIHRLLQQRIEEHQLTNTHLIGPAPCFYPRLDKLYRWHVIVRGPSPETILYALRPSFRLQIDIDPVSVL